MATSTGQLLVQLEGKVIQTIALTMPLLDIGRSPESALSLHHQLVSRNHAELRMESQGPVLTDLGSSNGTFIGTQRLLANQPHLLSNGSSFRIGPYTLIYQNAEAIVRAAQQEPNEGVKALDAAATEAIDQPLTAQPIFQVRAAAPQALQAGRRSIAEDAEGLYRRFLPDIFYENDFLRRFLLIFEDIWEPLEQRQDHIALYFDPRTCPVSFLPWLASWLDLPFNAHWPEARRRHLLAQAMELYRWRGTQYGLKRMIEVCTGVSPVITEEPAQPFVFRIRVALPPGLTDGTVDKDLIEDLIRTHKPAYAGYILEVIL